MLELDNVTLVAPTGTNEEMTLKALIYSIKDIKFNKVKYISHVSPKYLPKGVIFEESSYIMNTYKKYNQYVFEELYRHVDTEYCLLIQYDGFVIDSSKWSEEYLQYDYIGAPWEYSESAYITDYGEHVRVGNGGFSLRSKSLLEAPKKYNIPFQERQGFWNEDGNICVYNRKSFLDIGIKYAPLEVACKFSKEKTMKENENIYTFGFHQYHGSNIKYRGLLL